MPHISRDSLWSLEQYHKARPEFRAKVIEHKKARTVHLGPNLTVFFEDEMTIRYQVQEMLRVERIFEDEGIMDELSAYNPLIPDGQNFKATMLIEYTDVNERQAALARLKGVEDKVYIQVQGFDKVFAIADEDLDRESDEKTSAVHFLRFELTDSMASSLKAGGALSVGVEHSEYGTYQTEVSPATRQSLAGDLN